MTQSDRAQQDDPNSSIPTPKQVAPPKNTAGGGFVFEDAVVAYLLAYILTDLPPLEPDLGTIQRIDFQVRPDGWYLDDALLTLQSAGGRRRCALSIKSNAQFGARSAPADFVETAWMQMLHEGSTVFDENTDYLGLLTGPLPHDTSDSLHALLGKATAGDPTLLDRRIVVTGWANEVERSLYASFACPMTLVRAAQTAVPLSGRLLQRIRHVEFDFERQPSRDVQRAVQQCRAALRSAELAEAQELWNRLLAIAAEYRPKAGSLTRQLLLDRLRGHHQLKEAPQYADDWVRLSDNSRRTMNSVSDRIGQSVHLDRSADIARIEVALTQAPAVILLADSGAGKSAIVKQWSMEHTELPGEVVLWFEATSFECRDFQEFEAGLRLSYSLAQLLRETSVAHATLVLDGLDRSGLGVVERAASLVRMLDLGRLGGPWRVIVMSRPDAWADLAQTLFRLEVPVDGWEAVRLEQPDLTPVREAFPTMAKLFVDRKLRAVLANLKALDFIATRVVRGRQIDLAAWAGESSLIDWFWKGEVQHGIDAPKRMRFVQVLAEKQAGELRASVPLDHFDVEQLEPLAGLIHDDICRQTDDMHLAFSHDLYGDWVRQRLLVSHTGDLASYLAGRLPSPLWHRALRLHGVSLLEQPDGILRWRAAFAAFERTPGGGVAQDLLLDSVVFAADPGPLLDRLAPDLFAADGLLLRRLLERFLHFATVPDRRVLAVAGVDDAARVWVAARYRIPYSPLWPPILQFLQAHQNEVISHAPLEVSRVVTLWLDIGPTTWPLRTQAAMLGLALGEMGIEAYRARNAARRRIGAPSSIISKPVGPYSKAGIERANGDRGLLYRAALSGARESPDEVADFALRASMRRAVPPEVSHNDAAEAPLRKTLTADPRFNPNEPLPDPWPDGPLASVDDAFSTVAIAEHALAALMEVRPAVAREVALATLIRHRLRYEWSEHPEIMRHLGIVDDHVPLPVLYIDGPFLALLRADFEEGLELVARLVNFASVRWAQQLVEEHTNSSLHGAEADQPHGFLAQLSRDHRRLPGRLLLPTDSMQVLIGDDRVYGWCAGLGNPPRAIEAALMALEQYFYERVEEDALDHSQVVAVLGQARSVALLKVLCDIGRHQPELFEGPLSPLLLLPEVYRWDFAAQLEGRENLMMGAFQRGDHFVAAARQFHDLAHRRHDLRDVALTLLPNRAQLRPLFVQACREWTERAAAEPDQGMKVFLEQLVVRLTFENWQSRMLPDHTMRLVNIREEELAPLREPERRADEDRLFLLTFPTHCRMILDGEPSVESEGQDAIWASIQRLLALDGQMSGDAMTATMIHRGVCGGIAVLAVLHPDWLDLHAHRATWCREWLVAAVSGPSEEHLGPSEDVSGITLECFAADAVSAFWMREPQAEDLRGLIGRLTLAHYYRAVETIFIRCATQRTSFHADFTRLRRLLFEWAYVRARIDNARFYLTHVPDAKLEAKEAINDAAQRWAEERLISFVEAAPSAEIVAWGDMDPAQEFQEIDALLPAWRREEYPFDFDLIRSAHTWLPTPNLANDPEERTAVVTFWQQALMHILARPARWSDPRRHYNQHFPATHELWVLEGVAAAILHLTSGEHPELLWRPILSLQDEAEDWVDWFLRPFHLHALQADVLPDGYVSLVRAMFNFAVAQRSTNDSLWRRSNDPWQALLGLSSYAHGIWTHRHVSTVAQLADLFEEWAREKLGDVRCLTAFARFLMQPAADILLFNGLVWIADTVAARPRPPDDRYGQDALAALLDHVWGTHRDRLSGDERARKAYEMVLNALLQLRHPVALELQARSGNL